MASQPHVLALDLGTSSLKAVAFDPAGTVLGFATAAYPTSRPAALAAEQDPDDWWRAARRVISELRARPTLAGSRTLAIGLSGQMHGVVLHDKHSRVLRPCLTWADERGTGRLDSLASRAERVRVLSITGNPLNAGFSAAKLDWLRSTEPDAWRAATTILFPKDEVRWRLTGEIATDPSDASGSLLLDLSTRMWSEELAAAWEIDTGRLPPILPSAAFAGTVQPGAASDLGLDAGVPVVAGAGDTVAAAAGLAVGTRSDGAGMLGIGTAAQLLVASTAPLIDPHGRLNVLCHALPNAWCSMAAVLDGGGALAWIRAVVGASDEDFGWLVAEAELVPPGAEGLTFLPHLSGERTPGMDASTRASFIGLTARHGRAHLVRAVLEGVAYSLREGLDILGEAGMGPSTLRMAGMPAGSSAWVPILADVLGVGIHLSDVEQASARGAGLLAATALDPSASVAWSQALDHALRLVEPSREGRSRYDDGFGTYSRLREALRRAG